MTTQPNAGTLTFVDDTADVLRFILATAIVIAVGSILSSVLGFVIAFMAGRGVKRWALPGWIGYGTVPVIWLLAPLPTMLDEGFNFFVLIPLGVLAVQVGLYLIGRLFRRPAAAKAP